MTACGIHIGLRSKPGRRRKGLLLPGGNPFKGVSQETLDIPGKRGKEVVGLTYICSLPGGLLLSSSQTHRFANIILFWSVNPPTDDTPGRKRKKWTEKWIRGLVGEWRWKHKPLVQKE